MMIDDQLCTRVNNAYNMLEECYMCEVSAGNLPTVREQYCDVNLSLLSRLSVHNFYATAIRGVVPDEEARKMFEKLKVLDDFLILLFNRLREELQDRFYIVTLRNLKLARMLAMKERRY